MNCELPRCGCGIRGIERTKGAARILGAVAGCLVIAAGQAASTSETPAGNPYSAIPERNAFGIRPPPPPPHDEPPPPPPPPPSNIFLTGICAIHGVRKAYLVVNLPGGKPPKYVTVDEAYDTDGLKVLGISAREGTVKIVNGTVEQTLNFKDNGMKAGGAPGAPGQPPPPGGPAGFPPQGGPRPIGFQPQPHPVSTATDGPTIIGRRRMREEADNAGVGVPAFQGGFDPGAREIPAATAGAGFGNGFEGGAVSLPAAGAAAQPAANNGAGQADGGRQVPAVNGPVSNPTSGRPGPPIPGR